MRVEVVAMLSQGGGFQPEQELVSLYFKDCDIRIWKARSHLEMQKALIVSRGSARTI
jgi:hypothetical protein